MNPEKFSQAMGEVDDRYYMEAERYHRGRGLWLRRGAAAACLCVVLALGLFWRPLPSEKITAPGFLTVTACAAPSRESFALREGVELPLADSWSLAISSRPGIPFQLSAPEYPEAVFEVWAEGGTLLLWENNRVTPVESPFTAENGATVFWSSLSQAAGGRAYLDILIREGRHIVGYAVVEIAAEGGGDAPAPLHCATLLKSVSFPQVDGDYQAVTEGYVKAEMEKLKGGGAG